MEDLVKEVKDVGQALAFTELRNGNGRETLSSISEPERKKRKLKETHPSVKIDDISWDIAKSRGLVGN